MAGRPIRIDKKTGYRSGSLELPRVPLHEDRPGPSELRRVALVDEMLRSTASELFGPVCQTHIAAHAVWKRGFDEKLCIGLARLPVGAGWFSILPDADSVAPDGARVTAGAGPGFRRGTGHHH